MLRRVFFQAVPPGKNTFIVVFPAHLQLPHCASTLAVECSILDRSVKLSSACLRFMGNIPQIGSKVQKSEVILQVLLCVQALFLSCWMLKNAACPCQHLEVLRQTIMIWKESKTPQHARRWDSATDTVGWKWGLNCFISSSNNRSCSGCSALCSEQFNLHVPWSVGLN